MLKSHDLLDGDISTIIILASIMPFINVIWHLRIDSHMVCDIK
jgi:hypothetical protein